MAKRKEYFVALPESLITSPAYRILKPPARALLVEFLHIYRPSRNGRLTITEAQAKTLLNVSEKIAARAFYELSEHGFIKLIKHQNWMNKDGREWAVTMNPVNDREPTCEYLKWSKGENMNPDIKRPMWLR